MIWVINKSYILQVNINELKGKSLNFYDLSTLKIENTLSTKIDIIPYRNVEETNMTVVVPSEITKKLSLSKCKTCRRI